MTKIFTNGLRVHKPSDKAPEFIIANLTVDVDEFKAFLDTHAKEGVVRIDIKESQKGGYYGELNTFVKAQSQTKPAKVEPTIEYPEEEINPDDIPF